MKELSTVNTNLPAQWGSEQTELLKRTICKDATNDEFKLFSQLCKRTGLDPFARQIYFIKSGGKVQIQTSIDGFRLVAERTGKYEGQTKPEWCGEDGKWVDVWLQKKPPAAARVGVYKAGFREALYAIALFDEYAQKTSNGLSFMWNKMPSLMISKVAESLALRRAFPNDLSGLYTSDEMAQAEPAEYIAPEPKRDPIREVKTQIRAVEEDPGEFVPTFGKYKGQKLNEITIHDLAGYVAYIEESARRDNKPILGQVLSFMNAANRHIDNRRPKDFDSPLRDEVHEFDDE